MKVGLICLRLEVFQVDVILLVFCMSLNSIFLTVYIAFHQFLKHDSPAP